MMDPEVTCLRGLLIYELQRVWFGQPTATHI